MKGVLGNKLKVVKNLPAVCRETVIIQQVWVLSYGQKIPEEGSNPLHHSWLEIL